jgi:hypothetical protein
MHQFTRKIYSSDPIDDEANLKKTEYVLPAIIKLSPSLADQTFQQGASYKVTIKIWGLREIELTTNLIGWQDGGGIQIAPEEDPNPYGWQ